jgi:hypothetical protein
MIPIDHQAAQLVLLRHHYCTTPEDALSASEIPHLQPKVLADVVDVGLALTRTRRIFLGGRWVRVASWWLTPKGAEMARALTQFEPAAVGQAAAAAPPAEPPTAAGGATPSGRRRS